MTIGNLAYIFVSDIYSEDSKWFYGSSWTYKPATRHVISKCVSEGKNWRVKHIQASSSTHLAPTCALLDTAVLLSIFL